MRLLSYYFFFIFACCAVTHSTHAVTDSDAVAQYNQLNPESATLSDGYVSVNGASYHYVSAGEGPLVILYHGFPSFWYAWKSQIPALSKHYRVVAVDGLGSNLSDKPVDTARYRIDKLADDLNQLAYKLGGDRPFHLIGHDWGGALSWAFAQNHPNRVEKLVVLNAPPYNLFRELLRDNEKQKKTSRYISFLNHPMGEALLSFNDSYLISRMAYQKHLEHQHLNQAEAALFRQALSRPQALHSAINWYRANMPSSENISDDDRWPLNNPTIEVPSLLIWGVKDKTFVPEFLEMLPDYASQLTINKIPDAAHWPNLTHHRQVNETIIEFLRAP